MIDGLFQSEDGAALRFFVAPDKNNFQTEKQARPIYDEVLYVEVITPGSRESAPVFELERKHDKATGIEEPTRTPHFAKYVKQIEAFRSGGPGADMRGTPLSGWPALDVSLIATLNEGRIYTVEALANISDEKLRVIGPGGSTLRERAKAFLDAAAGNAPSEALAAENAALREQIAQQQNTMQSMQEAIAKLQNPQQQQNVPVPPLVTSPGPGPLVGALQTTAPVQLVPPLSLNDPFSIPTHSAITSEPLI